MKFSTLAIALLLLAAANNHVASFSTNSPAFYTTIASRVGTTSLFTSSSSSSSSSDTKDALGLTPELRKLTDAFERIGDDQLRYKQLLYMASNGLKPMPDSLKMDENKVLGCLSTVHVHATAEQDAESGNTLIHYTGDSDGLLTKGLVALLVRWVSWFMGDVVMHRCLTIIWVQCLGIALQCYVWMAHSRLIFFIDFLSCLL